jgi:hypothetical protein
MARSATRRKASVAAAVPRARDEQAVAQLRELRRSIAAESPVQLDWDGVAAELRERRVHGGRRAVHPG